MFGQTSDPKKKPEEKPDMVKRLQDYAKKKQAQDEEEKKKKKKEGVETKPSPGIIDRLYEFWKGTGGKKEGDK